MRPLGADTGGLNRVVISGEAARPCVAKPTKCGASKAASDFQKDTILPLGELGTDSSLLSQILPK
jgi:hypothetical protein